MLAMLLILKTSQDLILIRQITQECVHTCTQNSSKSRDCTHNNNLLKVPYIKWKMKAVRAFCVFFKAMKILFNLRFYTYTPVVVFFFISHSLSVILLISSSFSETLNNFKVNGNVSFLNLLGKKCNFIQFFSVFRSCLF